MRTVWAAYACFAFIFVEGALIAPWIHASAAAAASPFPILEPTVANPFHGFVNRSFLLLGLLGLWPFLRTLGTHSWREIGREGASRGWRLMGEGFAVLSLLAMVAMARFPAARREECPPEGVTAGS